MKRGEVYLGELLPRSGSEQQGTRPVVVVSHDSFNTNPSWNSIIVVPVTTSGGQARRGPSSVPLVKGAGGLKADSFAICHQVTTLDRSKLKARWGVLSTSEMESIEAGLKVAMALR